MARQARSKLSLLKLGKNWLQFVAREANIGANILKEIRLGLQSITGRQSARQNNKRDEAETHNRQAKVKNW